MTEKWELKEFINEYKSYVFLSVFAKSGKFENWFCQPITGKGDRTQHPGPLKVGNEMVDPFYNKPRLKGLHLKSECEL